MPCSCVACENRYVYSTRKDIVYAAVICKYLLLALDMQLLVPLPIMMVMVTIQL